ncbi:MAG TPA: hypothetical protein CFH82_07400 [Sulfurospirillum sp. UBA12182]|nr:MAG TPA: hypothetical protein CFH82_07400 [Sulfurospirillum sp. UBA12182]
MGIFDIFKKKEKSLLDEVYESTVALYRAIGKAKDIAPTEKMSNEEILSISKEVMSAFKQAGIKKGEHIPGGYLMSIAMKFFAVYEQFGLEFYNKHLEYEIANYYENGLREAYQVNLLQMGEN